MLLTTDGGTRLVSRPLHTGKSRGEYLTACQQLQALHQNIISMSEGEHNDNNMTINNDTDEMQPSPSGTNINQCQPIVNGLLTYLISMMNNSTDSKLVEVTGRYFDLGQVKHSKSLLCDVEQVPVKKRQDSESRTEKPQIEQSALL